MEEEIKEKEAKLIENIKMLKKRWGSPKTGRKVTISINVEK